jgi:hypothetical protein
MITTQDIAVAVMAALVGLLMVAGSLLDSAHLMNLAKPRLLAESVGRRRARVVLGCLGLAVLVIAAFIASGWRIRW